MKPVYLVTLLGIYPEEWYKDIGCFDDRKSAINLAEKYKVNRNEYDPKYEITVTEWINTKSEEVYKRKLNQ